MLMTSLFRTGTGRGASERTFPCRAWERGGVALLLLLVVSNGLRIGCRAAEREPVVSDQSEDDAAERLVLIVRGASGNAEYGRLFDSWCERWADAATQGRATALRVGPAETVGNVTPNEDGKAEQADRTLIEQTLRDVAASAKLKRTAELWVVLIGHGTFDGRSARFNLRGQDVSADDLAAWLAPVSCPVAIANCASASGPFLKALAGPHRVVLTATKSGTENNFAHFGEYLSDAIGDPGFDLDKDGQTSLFEAYLSASRRTESFYETEGRLATEHALLDDNGDGLGVRADFFRGIRLTKKVQDGAQVDGRLAHQFHLVRSDSEQQLAPETRRLRDQLELTVVQLRDRKQTFEDENAYYVQLESLLVQLAAVYESTGADSKVNEESRR
jgi:hypothetical protein